MHIERWSGGSAGRSRIISAGGLVWTVANARDPAAPFEGQVAESLAMLDAHLREGGSARTHLLSLQVLLADIHQRTAFDRLWQAWVGPEPDHWPQRACYQAELAPGLLIELVAVAAVATASLHSQP